MRRASMSLLLSSKNHGKLVLALVLMMSQVIPRVHGNRMNACMCACMRLEQHECGDCIHVYTSMFHYLLSTLRSRLSIHFIHFITTSQHHAIALFRLPHYPPAQHLSSHSSPHSKIGVTATLTPPFGLAVIPLWISIFFPTPNFSASAASANCVSNAATQAAMRQANSAFAKDW